MKRKLRKINELLLQPTIYKISILEKPRTRIPLSSETYTLCTTLT